VFTGQRNTIIEKDFWVSWTLKQLIELQKEGEWHFTFATTGNSSAP
jgi:hypothetical protein